MYFDGKEPLDVNENNLLKMNVIWDDRLDDKLRLFHKVVMNIALNEKFHNVERYALYRVLCKC